MIDEFFQKSKILQRQLFVDPMDGVPGMADDIVANGDVFVNEIKASFTLRAIDIDNGEVVIVDGQDFAGKGNAHT